MPPRSVLLVTIDGQQREWYNFPVIESFRDPETEKIFNGYFSKKLPTDIQKSAYRKLKYLNQVVNLLELRALPGHRLEKLTGDRQGQYSIRINNQWRICFYWRNNQAQEVEIVDYHN
jgi:proteic killer suppression protein